MHVYRVAYLEADMADQDWPGAVRYEWCGSLAEARDVVREAVRAGKCDPGGTPTITSMYVPAKKDGLLRFLNLQAQYVRGMCLVLAMCVCLCLGGCGTARGLIDGVGHLGAGIVQDVRAAAVGVSDANFEASRKGEYH